MNDRRSRSRSRSRGRDSFPRRREHSDRGSRYREDERGDRGHHYQRHSLREEATPTRTVIVKGLGPHVNDQLLYNAIAAYSPQDIRIIQQRDSSEGKGYAFVEFYSVEYASLFMQAFAGSAGDPTAPQLIIDSRAVTIDYAKDKEHGRYPSSSGGADSGQSRPIKSDWICEVCSGQNFSRRSECYRCSSPRTERSLVIGGSGMGPRSVDMLSDSTVSTSQPSRYLVVRGLGPYTTEDQVTELFRQFAAVTSVVIIRDTHPEKAGVPRPPPLVYVEFQSPEHASYAMTSSEQNQIQGVAGTIKIAFAKESYMHTQILAQQQLYQQQTYSGGNSDAHGSASRLAMGVGNPALNAMTAAALESMRWSSQAPVQQAASNLNSDSKVSVPLARIRPEFPPCFESQGGSYVFQPGSGYFYEPNSEYYYCPRSKLYYNADNGTYFRYQALNPPQFVRFDPPLPIGGPDSSPQDAESSNGNSDLTLSNGPRKPVVMSLGLSGGKTAKKPLNQPLVAGGSKGAFENIAKWGSVREELDSNSESNEARTAAEEKAHVSAFAVASQKSAVQSIVNAAMSTSRTSPITTSGVNGALSSSSKKPVCLLCRRQFASAEQLQRHERESKLHAENVAKQANS